MKSRCDRERCPGDRGLRWRVLLVGLTLCGPGMLFGASSDVPRFHTLTLDNQSGQNAVAKVVGPTRVVVKVPKDQKRSVPVSSGTYVLLVRYGNSQKEFTYAKSDPFSMAEKEGRFSILRVVLHRRNVGTFRASPVSAEEFNRAVSD